MTGFQGQYKPQFYTIDPTKPFDESLKDITDLVILAHADDAEIVAADKIAQCQKDPTRKLGVIIVTDGQGAARKGKYADFTNKQLADERVQEQVSAAIDGKFEFLAMLGQPDLVEHPIDSEQSTRDIYAIVSKCPKLESVITHNPFDRHPAHLGVLNATLGALKMLPPEAQANIKELRGSEVWGEVSWVGNPWLKKITLSKKEMDMQARLLGHHQSQTEGAKAYVPGVSAREVSRMVFEIPRLTTGEFAGVMLAVDMNSLIGDKAITLEQFADNVLEEHANRMRGNARKHEPHPPTDIEAETKIAAAFPDRISRIAVRS
ncbi:MAG: PIG-L family deacetylase [Rickettsiales bacterium]|nr:PIG-L family deacetylase [Rickettsiales bacterium]